MVAQRSLDSVSCCRFCLPRCTHTLRGKSLSLLISSVGVRMMPVSHGRAKNLGFVVLRSISLRLSKSVHSVRTMDCASLHRPARWHWFLSSLPSRTRPLSRGVRMVSLKSTDSVFSSRSRLNRQKLSRSRRTLLQFRFYKSETQSIRKQLQQKNEPTREVGGNLEKEIFLN